MQGSRRPHFPFYDKVEGKNEEIREARTQKTVEAAHLVLSHYGSIAEVDLQTAESTAQLVNSGKIDLGLLLYLTTPRVKLERFRLTSSHTKEGGTRSLAAVNDDGEEPTLEEPTVIKAPTSKSHAKSKKSRKRAINKSNASRQEGTTDDTNRSREDSPRDDSARSCEDIADEKTFNIHESPLLELNNSTISEDDSEATTYEAKLQAAQLGVECCSTSPDSSHTDGADNEAPCAIGFPNVEDALSEASVEQFYTPQESRNVSPTTPTRIKARVHTTPLKQELVAEKDALEEESTGWEVTPERIVVPREGTTPTNCVPRSVSPKGAKSSLEWPNEQVVIDENRASGRNHANSQQKLSAMSGRNHCVTSTQRRPNTFRFNGNDSVSPRHGIYPNHELTTDLPHKVISSGASSLHKDGFIKRSNPPKIPQWETSPKKPPFTQDQSVDRLGQYYLSTSSTHNVVDSPGGNHGDNASILGKRLRSDTPLKSLSLKPNNVPSPREDSLVTPSIREAGARTRRYHTKQKKHFPSFEEFSVARGEEREGKVDGGETIASSADIPIRGSGPQDLTWAYYSHTLADKELKRAGIWLWEKPSTYFEPLPLRAKQVNGITVPAPAIVEHNSIDNPPEPIIRFDNDAVCITPHFPPWPDARSNVAHPDFLPHFKLAEYQACEVAGYRVWRHDRDCLTCTKETCQKVASDYNSKTKVCMGCGPKSSVRYCSVEHELDDHDKHWRYCGDPNLVMQCIIDQATAPGGIMNLCPAIKECHGVKSFALHRQRHFAHTCQGHYTLFDPLNQKSTTLFWPKTDANWREMDSRIERLLNVAFLDVWKHSVLGYLYSLLRHLISITPLNSEACLQGLKTQFGAEFGAHIFKTTDTESIFPCECEWYGRYMENALHLQSCRYRNEDLAGFDRVSSEGMQKHVVAMETRFWILRAWAQQHPTVGNWQDRANGAGFGGLIEQEVHIRLGPGFVGWGADADNMCLE